MSPCLYPPWSFLSLSQGAPFIPTCLLTIYIFPCCYFHLLLPIPSFFYFSSFFFTIFPLTDHDEKPKHTCTVSSLWSQVNFSLVPVVLEKVQKTLGIQKQISKPLTLKAGLFIVPWTYCNFVSIYDICWRIFLIIFISGLHRRLLKCILHVS